MLCYLPCMTTVNRWQSVMYTNIPSWNSSSQKKGKIYFELSTFFPARRIFEFDNNMLLRGRHFVGFEFSTGRFGRGITYRIFYFYSARGIFAIYCILYGEGVFVGYSSGGSIFQGRHVGEGECFYKMLYFPSWGLFFVFKENAGSFFTRLHKILYVFL